jgi:hypothetical protein
MSNINISEGMIQFWKTKTNDEKLEINQRRALSNSKCIYIKKDEKSRAQACNPDNLIDYLALGYKICNTPKNLMKLEIYEIPNEFFI